MKLAVLAKKLGYTTQHLRRMVRDNAAKRSSYRAEGKSEQRIDALCRQIPGYKQTKGGHHYFVEGDQLTKWISAHSKAEKHYRMKFPARVKAEPIYAGEDQGGPRPDWQMRRLLKLQQGAMALTQYVNTELATATLPDWPASQRNKVLACLKPFTDFADKLRAVERDEAGSATSS